MIRSGIARRGVYRSLSGRVLTLAALVTLPGALGGDRISRVFIVTVLSLIVVEAFVSRARMNRVTLTLELPPMLTAGVETDIVARVDGPSGLTLAVHATTGVVSEAMICTAPSEGPVPVVAPERGVVTGLGFRLVGGDFIGLMAGRVDHVVQLTDPVPVAPEPLADPSLARAVEELVMAAGQDELVGVRPYQPGDRPSEVHWPSVARAGEILVRERRPDSPDRRPITIVASSLRREELEPVLARARWAVERVWSLGARASLVTLDDWSRSEPRTATVPGPVELAHQLAIAIPGACPAPAVTGPTLWIDQEGIRWTTPG